MNENIRKYGALTIIGLLWGASVMIIVAPGLGLATPVFPRPQPDYALISMILSGALLVGLSFKTGLDYLRSNQN